MYVCVFVHQVREFVITGHSLGAAVAAVLTVLFKDRHGDAPWIDRLRAVTFSTPAAIMRSGQNDPIHRCEVGEPNVAGLS